jgi:lysozyme family protein
MADFYKAHRLTGKFEGGYANNSNDSGAETWRGIARNFWPKLAMWKEVDKLVPNKPKKWNSVTFKEINKKLWASDAVNKGVDSFYESNFWDTVNLDNINSQEVANLLFDISVNMGTGRAAKFLQQSLYPLIEVDGKIGPKTLSAANAMNSKKLYDLILRLRKSKYDEIIACNPSQKEFKTTWYSRLVPFENANPTV